MTDEHPNQISSRTWWIAGVIVFGAFMAGLDTSLVNVGLDTVAHNLHGSLSTAQWIASDYLLALAAALPACGWLGRRVGVARLWLGALVGFTLASVFCAASSSLMGLILGRVAQGVAGGLLVPSGQTILGRAAGPRHMGTVMNTAGIAVVLTPAVGPTVGGLLITHLSWRWLFLVNLPIGITAFVLGTRILPRDGEQPPGRLDLVGLLLLTTGLPLVTYGLIAASEWQSFLTPTVLATLPAGVLSLLAYVVHARRARPDRRPILDLGLFGNRTYAAAQLSVLFCGASLAARSSC